jgi:tRNA(Ile)-lysidine synthase
MNPNTNVSAPPSPFPAGGFGFSYAKAKPADMTVPPPLAERFRADLEMLTGVALTRLGIAVSGGPDSLALLLLAHAAFPGEVHAATVDHRLRPQSADEARLVGQICGGLEVPHAILAADAPIQGNLQAGARALRYRLLGRWAAEAGIGWLLTAHHADDQAETLAMRLGRGAGLKIARPLLGWRREALAAIVAGAGLEPVLDPSNEDERFDRARIRKRLAEEDWLDPLAAARSAAALAEAEDALDWAAGRLFEERVKRTVGAAAFDPAELPPELRRRIVLRLLGATGDPPRGEAVQRLLGLLESGGTATLAGVKCEGGAVWRFTPEPPRRAS